jgi:hypothetical protein
MSGYSEMWAGMNHKHFVERWVPEERMIELNITDEGTRWFLARALAAEAELKEIKSALKVLREAIK